MKIKVANNDNLARDSLTGSIINVSEEEYLKYRKRKTQEQREKDRANQLEIMKNDIEDLKRLVSHLANVILENNKK